MLLTINQTVVPRVKKKGRLLPSSIPNLSAMVRKKPSRPNRSRGIIGDINFSDNIIEGGSVENTGCSDAIHANGGERNVDSSKSVFVACDQSYWDVDGHLDIAEVVLKDVRFANGFSYNKLSEDCCRESGHYLRFQMYKVEEHSCRLGQWPIVSADKIFLEYVALIAHCSENGMSPDVILSANFDGPDEGVSGLVHLASQKLLTLRPVLDDIVLESGPSFRVRVEILKSAFDACGSLLENTRQPWKKSMVNVMAWLRPEVTTQEVKYGISEFGGFDKYPETMVSLVSRKHARFDAAGFYEALKPSKEEPMLEDEFPELLLQLRPYQRRAAYWMVQREKGTLKASVERTPNQLISPFCVPVDFLDRHSRMFYNPFSGSVSLQPESASYVSGGILAGKHLHYLPIHY
ncbi:hypothetical protein MRB53_033128 [Persea americana]|uniref:Uncharacterized protein n=1 Tax=Persea americana TaxID=3435 RepID=A0ACC2KUC2_PERAE|nr:hypothetical protein MRB53_033128 [Persea americana]